jgi:SAM-dependent methyltransferase
MMQSISLAERKRQWDEFAEPYSRWVQDCPPNMLDELTALAADRPALDLGAGAGRICIPLARRNIPTTAVELSSRMIERMREAARREAISDLQILQCDFSCLVTEGRYGLAYCVDNSFFALCSEEEQLRCFESVASVLERDGFFVIEANAPTPKLLKAGARTIRNTPTNAVVERFRSDGGVALNLVTESTIKVTGEIVAAARSWTLAHHYVSASKFDEYASASKMQTVARWSDWNRAPYDGNPWRHISIWRPA